MSLPFLKLEPEKQERILNAAMKEFAKKGYDDASTNEIVKEANIGKGRLFHYFNTKKELFLYLYDYSMEIIKTEYFDMVAVGERDIFARLRQAYFLKMDMYKKHPWMFDFVKIVVYTDSEQVKEDIKKRSEAFQASGYGDLFENIDESKFKDGIDVQKAKDLIFWAIGGYGNKVLEDVKELEINQLDNDGILVEFDAYLEVLRKCFYK
ncbi:MAG TPA: TetR/AcrR family transcriptional regulator [Clostridia bacterium]|nr:TetR/AcrR family transcriptional regulator [Clostridia bacterium]